MFYELVSDGELKAPIAARKAGMSVEQFVTNMHATGYKEIRK